MRNFLIFLFCSMLTGCSFNYKDSLGSTTRTEIVERFAKFALTGPIASGFAGDDIVGQTNSNSQPIVMKKTSAGVYISGIGIGITSCGIPYIRIYFGKKWRDDKPNPPKSSPVGQPTPLESLTTGQPAALAKSD